MRLRATAPTIDAQGAASCAESNLTGPSSSRRLHPTCQRMKSRTSASNSDVIPEKALLLSAPVARDSCHDVEAFGAFDSKGLSQQPRLAAPSDDAARCRHQLGAGAPASGSNREYHESETLGEPWSTIGKNCSVPQILADSLLVSPSPSEQFGVGRLAERASSKSSAAAGLRSASSLSCSATPVCESAFGQPQRLCTTPLLIGRSGGHSRSVRLHDQQRLRRLVRLDSSCLSESAERTRIEASGGSARRVRLDASASLAKRMLESPKKSLEKLRPGKSIDTIQQLLFEASSSTKKTMPSASAGSPAKIQREAASYCVVQMPAPSSCDTQLPLKASDGDSKRVRSGAKVRKPDDFTRRRRKSISGTSTATAPAQAVSGHRAEKTQGVGSAGNAHLATSAAAAVGSSFEELQRRAVGSRSDIARESRGRTKEKPWEHTAAGEPMSGSNGDCRVSRRTTDYREMPHGGRGSSGWTMSDATECGDRDAKSSVTRAAAGAPLASLSRPAVLSKTAHLSSHPRRLTESVCVKKVAAVDVVRSSHIPAKMSSLGVPVTNTNDGAPVYQRLLRMQAGEPTLGRLLPSQMYEKWRQELQQKQPQCESVHSGKLQTFDNQPKPVGRSPSGSEGSSKRSGTDRQDGAARPPSSAAVVAITEVNRGDNRVEIEGALHMKPLSSATAGRGVVSRESSRGSGGRSSSPLALLGGRKVGASRGKDTASSAGAAAVMASGADGPSKVVPKCVPVDLHSSEASMQHSKPPKTSSGRRSSRGVLSRRVSDLKNLTDDQLHLLIQKHHGYLRDVRNGKVECWRHAAFGVGSMRLLRSLDLATPASIVTGEQLELIAETLSKDKALCDSTLTSVDYVMRVLVPEMLILLYMDVHNISRRDAEAALKKMCM